MKQRIKINICDFGGSRHEDIFLHEFLQKNYAVEISSAPDFLLYSSKGREHRNYNCPKIFFTDESIYPDFSVCDYALTCFHLNNPRHLRLPLYAAMGEGSELIKSEREMSEPSPLREKFCSFVVANVGRRTRHRIDFFEKLNARLHVDSAGRALNNTGKDLPHGHQNKIDFLRSYRFNIAFENKQWAGYNTEKLFQAMAARCIPIYFGDPLVAQEFNPKSFINCQDYPSLDALVDHVCKVENDPELQFAYQKEPFFHENQPNLFFSTSRLKTFFDRIFAERERPVFQQGFWISMFHGVQAKGVNRMIKARVPR